MVPSDAGDVAPSSGAVTAAVVVSQEASRIPPSAYGGMSACVVMGSDAGRPGVATVRDPSPVAGALFFLATALGTIRHQGVDAPPPDTLEGLLYALPEDRHIVDARGLATALGHATPTPRVSPWFGYSPLDPAYLASHDGIVFVKDTPRT